jgi:hypothetical protein
VRGKSCEREKGAAGVERGGDGDLVISDLRVNKLGREYLWRKRAGGYKFGPWVQESGARC